MKNDTCKILLRKQGFLGVILKVVIIFPFLLNRIHAMSIYWSVYLNAPSIALLELPLLFNKCQLYWKVSLLFFLGSWKDSCELLRLKGFWVNYCFPTKTMLIGWVFALGLCALFDKNPNELYEVEKLLTWCVCAREQGRKEWLSWDKNCILMSY